MEEFTETCDNSGGFNFAYDELSPLAKKLLLVCFDATIVSPLERCRIMKEAAKGAKLYALYEVERYLIND
jgi:hypothetical protein